MGLSQTSHPIQSTGCAPISQYGANSDTTYEILVFEYADGLVVPLFSAVHDEHVNARWNVEFRQQNRQRVLNGNSLNGKLRVEQHRPATINNIERWPSPRTVDVTEGQTGFSSRPPRTTRG